jgi:transcriptional regulator with XRE-family HTH domain
VPNRPIKQVVAANLTALLEYHEQSPEEVAKRAVYRSGRKAGNKVGARTLRNAMNADVADSPSLELVAAIAKAFGLQAWQLLFPKFSPRNPPVLALTPEEEELTRKFEQLTAELAARAKGRERSETE